MTRETTPRDRAHAVLRDVVRSGGRDVWAHLSSHGHSFSTVWACVRRGWLAAPSRYHYLITPAGEAEVSTAELPAGAWCEAYREAFVAAAVSRGWKRDNALSWAVEIDEMARLFGRERDPRQAGSADVIECEREIANVL